LKDQSGHARAGVSYPTLEADIHSGMSLASLITAVAPGENLHARC